MRRFGADDVVLMEALRCSGADHDDCPKACMIFWREAWLCKLEDTAVQSDVDLGGREQLRPASKPTGAKAYFCQGSELSKAAHASSR
jgi:hypothetical protein